MLDRLSRLVAQASGIHVRPEGRWLLAARVEQRMRAVGDADPSTYATRVEADEAELGALVEAIRIGETKFFRHGAQLQALRRVVLPEVRARASAGDRKVRAWSAGCSTGEEPYTLAMLLDDAMPRDRGFDVQVLATDISDEALARAAAGRYDAQAIGPVPDALRARYFEPDGAGFRVGPALRSIVRFEARNLQGATYPHGLDVVLCRNVLIYFGPEGRDAVIRRLAASLVVGGFLFLGYSETLRAFEAEFEVISTEEGTLYRRRREASAEAGTGTGTGTDAGTGTGTGSSLRSGSSSGSGSRSGAGAAAGVIAAQGRYEEGDRRFAREMGEAMGAGTPVVRVDLDGAEILADDVARDLRRARAALEHEGRRLVVVATRPGVLRWLDRLGLTAELEVVREVPR